MDDQKKKRHNHAAPKATIFLSRREAAGTEVAEATETAETPEAESTQSVPESTS